MPEEIQPLKHQDVSYFPFQNGLERVEAEESNDVDIARLSRPSLTRTDNNISRAWQNSIKKLKPIKGRPYSVLYDVPKEEKDEIEYSLLSDDSLDDIGYEMREGDCLYKFRILPHHEYTYLPIDLANAHYFRVGKTNEYIPLFVIDTAEGQVQSKKQGWVVLRGIPSAISIHKK